ncbi:hypothetical protein [Prosthecobacter sp.]|uniref:hypothetical protein n=1 Tax=Prosthecobacter sp. TaxID=1965333 RepID=UPI002ABC8E3F|nr:hypothetical protein [Prosthecobacter sp.]MDZ4401680.1 hypothetical protein [Prosthecobacter sp.]
MGLDWNPGPKAKPGFEAEFESLWRKLLSKRWCWNRAGKSRRFDAITQSAFDTLKTPTVGVEDEATAWAHQQFEQRVDKSLTEELFVSRLTGFRVLPLIPRCDGLPRYTNGSPGGYVEAYAFRGQFLKDCEYIIGAELLNAAWESKLSNETIKYGKELLRHSAYYAKTHQIDLATVHLAEDPESVEFHLDVVESAGRWCVFWGKHGHWLEAYF